ncbi:hypothetical protein BJ875DRAFT_193500 [Amylocarpus encephaloides]|uniref:Uncharacterized protein n=1 Tax=Amylocarpus encephaloides TaxID=45428 RepID=A0A9P7YA89_9HELO|nr:hypothetical protein BJ875DRAFT_193500 [Amylocarpus encephaloides]
MNTTHPLRLPHATINASPSCRYLGIQMDSRLRWAEGCDMEAWDKEMSHGNRAQRLPLSIRWTSSIGRAGRIWLGTRKIESLLSLRKQPEWCLVSCLQFERLMRFFRNCVLRDFASGSNAFQAEGKANHMASTPPLAKSCSHNLLNQKRSR